MCEGRYYYTWNNINTDISYRLETEWVRDSLRTVLSILILYLLFFLGDECICMFQFYCPEKEKHDEFRKFSCNQETAELSNCYLFVLTIMTNFSVFPSHFSVKLYLHIHIPSRDGSFYPTDYSLCSQTCKNWDCT